MAVDKLINQTQGDEIIDKLDEIADKIHNVNYGLETTSAGVVQMAGYQKSSETTPGAISQGDTLNQAMGKLEKRIDNDETALAGKQATLTTEQLAAVNSGIDSTKVGQIATNTTDISSLQDTVGNKVDKVTGKDLSSNDYSDTEKSKLAGIEAGAEVNVQADWNQATSTDDSYIKNKPTLGTAAAADTTDFATAAQGTKADNAIPSSAKGVANGVAELDSNGKVPSAQLPSYVDDVLEYSAKSSFPATGETGKIYVDTSTNKTYRWSGSAYVEVSESLALGETSSTAYRGDRGKAAYNHSQTTSGNPHNVTAAEVGAVPKTSAGVSDAINLLTTDDSVPTDNDYYVSQYVGGGTSTTTYHRRPISKIWEYIKGKLSSIGSATQPVYFSNGVPVATTYTLGKSVPSNAVFTDTTYSSKSAASGGTDVSLCTTGEKYTWNNKGTYSKPSGGIPKTDLASAVQTSLGKADTALQSHQTVKQDGVTGATVNRFGTCSTAADTAAKTVSITSGTFNLEAGARVSVKFTNANTAGTPTLNVNSKGAKNIFSKGSQITTGSNKSLLAGTVDFIYDGTQWHLIGNYIDTNTTYSNASTSAAGIVQLSNSLTSTSQTQAATPYAVKQLNDTIGNINSVLEAVL